MCLRLGRAKLPRAAQHLSSISVDEMALICWCYLFCLITFAERHTLYSMFVVRDQFNLPDSVAAAIIFTYESDVIHW